MLGGSFGIVAVIFGGVLPMVLLPGIGLLAASYGLAPAQLELCVLSSTVLLGATAFGVRWAGARAVLAGALAASALLAATLGAATLQFIVFGLGLIPWGTAYVFGRRAAVLLRTVPQTIPHGCLYLVGAIFTFVPGLALGHRIDDTWNAQVALVETLDGKELQLAIDRLRWLSRLPGTNQPDLRYAYCDAEDPAVGRRLQAALLALHEAMTRDDCDRSDD